MRSHPQDFEPFLFDDEQSKAKDIEGYADEIEKTSIWGGEAELLALAKEFGVGVEVYSQAPYPVRINLDGTENITTTVQLVFYTAQFGSGSHYNSLHPDKAVRPAISETPVTPDENVHRAKS